MWVVRGSGAWVRRRPTPRTPAVPQLGITFSSTTASKKCPRPPPHLAVRLMPPPIPPPIPPPSSPSPRPPPPACSPSPNRQKRPSPFLKSLRLDPSPLRGTSHLSFPHLLPLPSRLFAKTVTHTQ